MTGIRTVRGAGKEGGKRRELIFGELLGVLVPSVLMCLPERASALPHCGGYGNLASCQYSIASGATRPWTHRIIGMVRQHICQQVGHPSLDGVGVAVHQCTDSQNRSMQLTNRSVIGR